MKVFSPRELMWVKNDRICFWIYWGQSRMPWNYWSIFKTANITLCMKMDYSSKKGLATQKCNKYFLESIAKSLDSIGIWLWEEQQQNIRRESFDLCRMRFEPLQYLVLTSLGIASIGNMYCSNGYHCEKPIIWRTSQTRKSSVALQAQTDWKHFREATERIIHQWSTKIGTAVETVSSN